MQYRQNIHCFFTFFLSLWDVDWLFGFFIYFRCFDYFLSYLHLIPFLSCIWVFTLFQVLFILHCL